MATSVTYAAFGSLVQPWTLHLQAFGAGLLLAMIAETMITMTKNDFDSLRQALEAKRAEVLRALEQSEASGTHAARDDVPDPMSGANRAEDEHELLGLADRESRLLSEIDHALAKFDAGTYGVSELSGRSIPIERLRAVPWARLTADEQERRASR